MSLTNYLEEKVLADLFSILPYEKPTSFFIDLANSRVTIPVTWDEYSKPGSDVVLTWDPTNGTTTWQSNRLGVGVKANTKLVQLKSPTISSSSWSENFNYYRTNGYPKYGDL